MLTQDVIEKFYKDVDRLTIKKKGAEITKATGFAKGTVSQYLNRKKMPSENFIDSFYRQFGYLLDKGSTKGNPEVEEVHVEKDRYVKLLEENDRFFKTEYAQLLLSLKQLVGLGMKQEALIKLNLQHTGMVEALQKGEDVSDIQEQINNQIAEIGPYERMDNDDDM